MSDTVEQIAHFTIKDLERAMGNGLNYAARQETLGVETRGSKFGDQPQPTRPGFGR